MVIEPENSPREMRRRRGQHEHIAGEATLAALLPKGYTLMVLIVAGTAYAAFAYSDISSNADSLKAIESWVETAIPRIRVLEQNQMVVQEQLKNIQKEQSRSEKAAIAASVAAAKSRSEIIDAIKDLKR